MDTFSRLNSTSPISPDSGRIWKAQKKQRTGDHKEKEEQKNQDAKDGKKDRDVIFQHRDKTETDVKEISHTGTEEEAVYGAKGHKKNVNRKIDVII